MKTSDEPRSKVRRSTDVRSPYVFDSRNDPQEKANDPAGEMRRLRALAADLHENADRERREIASALHDDLAQFLVAAKMKLELLGSELDVPSSSPLRDHLDGLSRLLERADRSVRNLIQRVRPQMLDVLDLSRALGWLAKEMEQRFDLEVRVRIDGELPPVPDRHRFVLFQCTRELLVNVVEHADAERAVVRLGTEEENRVRIQVEDGGVGFNVMRVPSDDGRGLGLLKVRERIENLGGSMVVASAPGKGTRATLSLPI